MRYSISTTFVLAAVLTVSRAFVSRQDWSSSRHYTNIHTPTTATTTGRLWGWSQQAAIFYDDDDDDDDDLSTTHARHPVVSLDDCSSTVVTTKEGTTLDLSSPREWLEHDGSPDGAYTVMRCDLGSINSDNGAHHNYDWHIWGIDFHLHRLIESFEACRYAQSAEGGGSVSVVDIDPTSIDTASTETRLVIHELLAAAARQLSPVLTDVVGVAAGGDGEHESNNNKHICVAMVTILWYLDPKSDGTNTVRVKGHVCSSGIPVLADPTKYDPDPIQLTLALLPSTSTTNRQSYVSNLPNRKDSYPEAKLSTWCRTRRPLELQFKWSGVGEVILVDECDDHVVHLLEGLTSNLFVLYPNDVLRTADTGVLHGYARQRVLEQAHRLGLTPDFTPIRLDESNLWLDCFVTSSVKLIAPVAKILVPVAGGDDGTSTELEEVWSCGNVANSRSVWRDLYDGIMLDHGTH